jgi:pimeloyl-ACP methyl ester carboxylesterase
MAFRHLRDILGEAGSLTVYAACSLVGAVVQPTHKTEGTATPVVLVPGFLGRGFAFLRLRQALSKADHPVYVADLGYGVGCLEEKSRLLEELIDDEELEDFYLVGHSMGGLIAMGMSDEYRRRVRHFITLGTTFRGAILSYLLPVFPAARQLQPRSSLVRRLLERVEEHDNLTTVVAAWDEIALPPRSCLVENCDVRKSVPGHAQLILRSQAIEHLVELLAELE